MARKRSTPAKPAAVSGPSALSQRTDGGPGSKTQPIRVASGQPYGDRQALVQAQQSAPLPVAPGGPPAGGSAAPAQAVMPDPNRLFAPSNRPGPGGPAPQRQFIPEDPNMLLKAIYQAFPHPEIARLMRAL
jgi:hypothetical protein